MVRRILSEGQLDVNSRDRRERTPVIAAACAGHKDVVKLLINAGSNVSLVEDHGYNIFHIATCIGHLGMVKHILSQNILDINSRTKCNRTPVMMAAKRGYRNVLAVLVSKGADVSLRDRRGNNILLYTCAGGQVEMVKYVLSLNKVDINRRGQRGWTSVMVAARLGNREMLDFLISKGSNVSLTANEDTNILHAACIGGHLEMVKYVVSQDFVDINSRRWNGKTPLMLSAIKGHRDVFDFVLSRGGNMSMVTKEGKNILHLVCQNGNLDMVKFILSKNLLDINARTNKGGKQFSPERYIQDKPCDQEGRSMDNQLHDACWEGDLNMNILDINSRTKCNRTPVMMAANRSYRNVLAVLVSEGADVSLRDRRGNNILHYTCAGGQMEMVKYVLSLNKVDINRRGQHGWTSLMVAARLGNREMLDFLMSKGSNVSLTAKEETNILHAACIGGHLEMVKYVVSQYFVDINSRRWNGKTALGLSAQRAPREVFDFILRRGGGKQFSPERYIQDKPCDQEGRSMDNQLHDACCEGNLNMVRRILSEGQLDVNSRDRRERTPVMAAACAGHKDVVKLLINAGSNVSLVEDHGYNIFHIATCIGQVAMVKYILSQNILDINSRTKCNRTPGMMAANRSYRNVLAVLVSEGADVSLRDQRGNDILHYTCAGGQVEMVKYVLSLNKVDINRRGQHGWTSVMVAAILGNREMLDCLISKGSNVSLTANKDTNIHHAACIGGHLEMVKYVVSQDFVDINSRRWNGKTALMRSAQRAHREVFDFILRRGGNMSMVTYKGENILHLVCKNTKGTLDMVKYIFSKNLLNINARTKQGDTAALIAKRRKNSEVHNFLVSHGGL
ncbi:serine/threonine-protein phosphatase 6 regulatory ankyrin repeat subunit B-like [Haliotis rufescens]|uniref:serine/threonine-protein phosphatase 6 regulatory ankyrin repeat subunit B-like n=1 Tax=Haliotis rufescens TaxID=6454 RepID=UPI00201F982C|nr:serine/threonine-protein phosphatase 6 regulatory ankyrin repeat subunit B-like [Haliotis rufescens]